MSCIALENSDIIDPAAYLDIKIVVFFVLKRKKCRTFFEVQSYLSDWLSRTAKLKMWFCGCFFVHLAQDDKNEDTDGDIIR